MSETKQATPSRKPFLRRRDVWIVTLALAVLGAGAVAVPAAMAFRGLGGHGFRHGMAHDPEKAKEHAAFAVEWAFRAVDATEEQKTEGRVVVERIVDQLIPLGERHRAQREALVREMSKPQIDRVALERLREDGLALADEASRIGLDGVADLAEVLSPEQRVELLELAHRFHRGDGRHGD
jgi:Spy/CpxP family protein refolding chaperone